VAFLASYWKRLNYDEVLKTPCSGKNAYKDGFKLGLTRRDAA